VCVCAKWKWEKKIALPAVALGDSWWEKARGKARDGDGWEREVQSESESWAKVFQFVYASSTQMSELLH